MPTDLSKLDGPGLLKFIGTLEVSMLELENRVDNLEVKLQTAVAKAFERLDCVVCGGDLSVCKHPQPPAPSTP